jgi:heat shock protein HslJ
MIITSAILVLFSCLSTKKSIKNQDFPSGNYLVLSLEDKTFSEKDKYIINIDTNQKRLGGKLDCNTFGTNYTLKDDNSIEFGYAMSTKMYCEGKMEIENRFFKKLNSMKFYKFEDDYLSFYDDSNSLILKLKRIN